VNKLAAGWFHDHPECSDFPFPAAPDQIKSPDCVVTRASLLSKPRNGFC
jgi:hypothetical protein